MPTPKVMFPVDYLRKGCGARPDRDSMPNAICSFLDQFHDDDSDAYWEKYLLWSVFAHEQVERLFPEWFAGWHEENSQDDGCCFPQDLIEDFGEEHNLEDCAQALDISEWPKSDWESGLVKRPDSS